MQVKKDSIKDKLKSIPKATISWNGTDGLFRV